MSAGVVKVIVPAMFGGIIKVSTAKHVKKWPRCEEAFDELLSEIVDEEAHQADREALVGLEEVLVEWEEEDQEAPTLRLWDV